MFEGTLVESCGLPRSATQRWTAAASTIAQCGVAALLITIPLLRPQALPMLLEAPRLVAPLPPRPPVPVVRVEHFAASTSALNFPAMQSPSPVAAARILLPGLHTDDPGPEPVIATGPGMGAQSPGTLLAALGPVGTGPNIALAHTKTTVPARLSSGVEAGLLLAPIEPVYPAMAKAAGVQGTVVMEAIISKTGRIESLRVVSGPPMLRAAALDAVQRAQYRPYRLNGDPTEVQTMITVNFRLGS